MLIKYLKKNKLTFIAGLILNLGFLYFVWIFLFSGDFLMPHSKNAQNREALLKIRERIKIEDNYEKVLNAYWENALPKLELNSENSDIWIVSMPPEFGATDWLMNIKFENGKVAGYKIRNMDGLKPLDAPEDIGKTDE